MNEMDIDKINENTDKIMKKLFEIGKEYPVLDYVVALTTYLTYAAFVQENPEIKIKGLKDMIDQTFVALVRTKNLDLEIK